MLVDRVIKKTMIVFIMRAFVALCLVSSVSACECIDNGPKFLQDIYCEADHVIQITITGSEEVEVDSNDDDPYRQRRYIINTPIVYKSSNAYNAVEDKNSLYTELLASACGILLEVGTTYIIADNKFAYFGGKLRIDDCSLLYKPVGQFTPDQLRNFYLGYATGCHYCNIQYCEDQAACDQIKPLKSRKTCIGYRDGLHFSCRDEYALCVRTGFSWYDTSCQWVDTRGSLGTCLN